MPPQLDELVGRMLAKERDDRPRDAVSVLRALEVDSTERPAASGSGLADRERRLVTIVLARRLPTREAVEVAHAQGAYATELADGAVLVELRGRDPATRAAACALSLSRLGSDATIGIATGRVGHGHGAAYGPILDRVAMMTARTTRGIPIDDVSASLLGDRFEIGGASDERVLVGPARSANQPRTLLGTRVPCIGRDKEVALLCATFRECASEPVARALLITGPAGSGKSRLAHELLAQLRVDATVLIARADPLGAGSALGVARQLVRDAAGLREGDSLAEQRAVLALHLGRFFCDDALERMVEMLGELVLSLIHI